MSFLKKLFTRTPEEYLGKGDALFEAHSFYEAMNAYQAGLEACRGKSGQESMVQRFELRIRDTNRSMAQRNVDEAEHALRSGAAEKAAEHLELAKSLTDDVAIREKAETILAGMDKKSNNTEALASPASCSSCSSGTAEVTDVPLETGADLSLHEHYDLLIHQLPEELYARYSSLGEDFACMFIAASHDRHQEALERLEAWFTGADRDIYWYEKGKILHRLGKTREAETCLRDAIGANSMNPLPHLALAILLVDGHRLEEAARQLEGMIQADIITGQALMMRGEVFQLSGDADAAISLYGKLLETPLARAAAEKLYALLQESGRDQEADYIFKRYLGTCRH
jgi:tetratricopeptide (TPR) repeat protein